jgi:hypothetical protein
MLVAGDCLSIYLEVVADSDLCALRTSEPLILPKMSTSPDSGAAQNATEVRS